MKDYFSTVVDIFKYPRHQLIKGSLSNDDGEVKENGKKVIGLAFLAKHNSTRASHFFVHFFESLPSSTRLRRENALFYVEDVNTRQLNDFLFLFLNFDSAF